MLHEEHLIGDGVDAIDPDVAGRGERGEPKAREAIGRIIPGIPKAPIGFLENIRAARGQS
jgi:hypothetical protein